MVHNYSCEEEYPLLIFMQFWLDFKPAVSRWWDGALVVPVMSWKPAIVFWAVLFLKALDHP